MCGASSALMTGEAYRTSAAIARELGPFEGFKENREHMLRVINNHRIAAHGWKDGYQGLSLRPIPLDHENLLDADLGVAAIDAWNGAILDRKSTRLNSSH